MRVSRHLVGSSEGMVQQLVTLVAKGYRYYFVGSMKPGTDRDSFDKKMLAYYEAHLPKWTRERRRQRGIANARYLRHEDWFVVLFTEGKAERFWREDKHRVRDVRHVPIRFKGYSVSYRQGGYKRLSSEERVCAPCHVASVSGSAGGWFESGSAAPCSTRQQVACARATGRADVPWAQKFFPQYRNPSKCRFFSK